MSTTEEMEVRKYCKRCRRVIPIGRSSNFCSLYCNTLPLTFTERDIEVFKAGVEEGQSEKEKALRALVEEIKGMAFKKIGYKDINEFYPDFYSEHAHKKWIYLEFDTDYLKAIDTCLDRALGGQE